MRFTSVKFFRIPIVIGLLFLSMVGCTSFGGGAYYRNSCYSYDCNYPNHGTNYPYYRSYNQYPSYRSSGSGNGGHNPLHIPSGRFHNVGRPSHWKL